MADLDRPSIDICAVAGEDIEFPFLLDSSLNLTSYNLKAKAINSSDPTLSLEFFCSVTSPCRFILALKATDTASLPEGIYNFDVKLTSTVDSSQFYLTKECHLTLFKGIS